VATKKYRVLRFMQTGYTLLGWLGICVAPFFLFGLPVLVALLSSARERGDALMTFLPIAVAGGFSALGAGITFLVTAQLIEVFVDIAANTQRNAILLERALNAPQAPTSNSQVAAA
jgi:hypothetical protein